MMAERMRAELMVGIEKPDAMVAVVGELNYWSVVWIESMIIVPSDHFS
jgi:hypothetical protein